MPATDHDALKRIIAFLRDIGVDARAEISAEDGQLPAMTVRDGVLFYDPDRLQWPGDLLHEAGHIAVTDPMRRARASDSTFGAVETADGDEMAAIAWSYAAALVVGIDPRVLFHDGGYKSEGAWLAKTFAGGSYIGLPMLQYYGLAAREGEGEAYPAMKRWLR